MNTQSFFISAPRSLLFASLLLGASLTPLAAQAIEVNGIVKLGTDFGGDELVKAVFTSGSSSSITANGGILLAGGVSLSNASRTFSVDTTVGWKSDLIDALNQSYEFSRNTFDVVAFFGIPLGEKKRTTLRLGAGATYIVHPEFTASGTLDNGTVRFEDALGAVIQVDGMIRFNRRLGINTGIRLTGADYKIRYGTGTFAGANGTL
ncbi:MAG: hypothetical protein OEV31_00770, partial [Gammaproteobacteria bacterium]|nr:hypothetical protein [Gammaproteobacteria bacterium]